MQNTEQHSDSAVVLATKMGPPASVSLATVAGYNVSDLVLWATLIYSVLLIGHKLWQIWRDVCGRKKRGD